MGLGRQFLALASTVLAAWAAGCDATDSGTAGIDRGGARTPVAVQGPITGFGSIIVNGVHYDVGDADVRIDGSAAAAADLALGQLVTVVGSREGDTERGTADRVLYVTNVQGPVTARDVGAGTLVVLGQRVAADGGTVFDVGGRAPSVASLAIGEVVRVSGFVDADGGIAATRIEQRQPGGELRVLGRVAALDSSAARFTIGNLGVSYAAATSIDGFPGGAPREGDEVIAVGSAFGSGGELLARTLELAHEVDEEAGQEFEIEGFITRFVSAADFDVSGLAVTTTSTTDFEGGSPASLRLGLKVHVAGRVNAALQREARKVEIED